MKSIYNLGEQSIKLAKSILTLILLITLLVLAIREQNITKNKLSYYTIPYSIVILLLYIYYIVLTLQ
jgi:hypothetical protein